MDTNAIKAKPDWEYGIERNNIYMSGKIGRMWITIIAIVVLVVFMFGSFIYIGRGYLDVLQRADVKIKTLEQQINDNSRKIQELESMIKK